MSCERDVNTAPRALRPEEIVSICGITKIDSEILATTGAGALLIGHGLSMTSYHAQDIKVPNISWKNSEVYASDLSFSVMEDDNVHYKKKNKKGDYENEKQCKKAKPGISGKEGAKDVPSWAKGNKPYKEESGRDFAKRLMDEKYGKSSYDPRRSREYSKIRKYGDRSFE